MITLGSRIKECRENSDMYQVELADRLNVSRACVSSWETDRTEPNLGQISDMANLFNVSVSYLATGENSKVQQSTDFQINAIEILKVLPTLDVESLKEINSMSSYLLKYAEKFSKLPTK